MRLSIASRFALLALTVVALSSACRGRVGEGGSCDKTSDCAGGLSCLEGHCQINPELHNQMARQSGVTVSTERASPVGPVSGAVRVRMATRRDFAFAVCADDERLIGGWCTPSANGSGDNTRVMRQGANGYSETDTIGARWKCELRRELVSAYALCQKVDVPRP